MKLMKAVTNFLRHLEVQGLSPEALGFGLARSAAEPYSNARG